MAVLKGFSYKLRLLTNIGILVWVSIIRTTSSVVRGGLTWLLLRVVPGTRGENGILVNTYESMRQRLKDSLREIEEKTQQLEESWDQLKNSRDLLQTTIDSIHSDLIVLDRELHITQTNQHVRNRYPDREITGLHCYEVTHGRSNPCQPPGCECPVVKVWQTGKPFRTTHVHTYNGSGGVRNIYLEILASPLFDRNGKVLQVVELTHDITESKEQEARILEANRALRALNTVASTVGQSLSLDTILTRALDKVLEVMSAGIGGILLRDEATGMLSYRVFRGLSERFIQNTALTQMIADLVAEGDAPFFWDESSRENQVDLSGFVPEEGLKAVIAVPVKSKDKVVGVLTIGRRAPRSFTRQDSQFLIALGHQLGMAVENALLYQELQRREQIRAELLRKLITAQEDERRRVARELHDVTSQALATLAVRVEALGSVVKSDTKGAESMLEEVRALLANTSREVHGLIYDLRPSLLDDLGLPAAVRSCAHHLLEAAKIEAHLELVGQERRLPPEIEIAVFRIIQEAITNVMLHSRAESVYISLEFKEKSIATRVEDDGIGFNPIDVLNSAHAKNSMGLLGMKERAELLQGSLVIDSQPRKGTIIALEIPLITEGASVQNKSTIG